MKKYFQAIQTYAISLTSKANMRGGLVAYSFYDNVIYSYGRHYVMGHFITPEIIVINDTGYSNSTSKHIGILASATRDKTQIFTMRAEPKRVAEQIRHNFAKLAHARKPEKYVAEIIYLYEGFVKACNKLGGVLKKIHLTGFIPVEPLDETNRHINEMRTIYEGLNTKEQAEQLAQIKETDKRLRKERALREQQRKAEQIEKFYNYEINYISGLENELLRLSKCGEYIETSQRVEIPLNEAQRYYRLLKSGANMRGQKIAQYITNSFDEVLQIGCHKIEKQEANKIGELILNL